MKVLVLGAGVIGISTAWHLAALGHRVTVVDRREGPGLETSFANGGQVSVSHAEPWANPRAPMQILKWLLREDAPLLFRLRADPRQWRWMLAFLCQCTHPRTRANSEQMVRLSAYSLQALSELREATGIEYDARMRGIVNFYTERAPFDAAVSAAPRLRRHGLEIQVKSAAEAVHIEPALKAFARRIVGATYTPSDQSGDAYKFTARLAALAAKEGVEFLYERTISELRRGARGIEAVAIDDGEALTADAYVLALGSWSPRVTRGLGLDIPIYPLKGYSGTAPLVDGSKAPGGSVTDDAGKIVITRLGERLRFAGTAELAGYSTELNRVRCEALVRRVSEIFPGAADYGSTRFWAGLRPSTPSNVPRVGRTKYPNLYLNTGHGTLGWTMAAGSGRALADIISGRKPGVDFQWSS